MKLQLRMLVAILALAVINPVYAGTVVDCARACASCEKDQVCYCDPGDGYLCLDKKTQDVVLDLQTILEEKADAGQY